MISTSAASLASSTLGVYGLAWPMFWFGFAITVLDFFDISLPRGDSVGVSGALVAVAVVLMGPLPTAIASIGSLTVVFIARLRSGGSDRPSITFAARLGAIGAAAAVAHLLGAQSVTWLEYARVAAVASVYLLVELSITQVMMAIQTGRPLARSMTGGLRMQGPLILAQASASVLVYIMYPGMSAWSMVPVVALLLLMRQSYALLLDIRETYRTTVGVLVQAAEGEDHRLDGHAERTAEIARTISMRLGLNADEVERISYAALMHDLDALSADPDQAAISAPASAEPIARGHSATVVEGAAFFADVVPMLRLCDGNFDEADSVSDFDRTGAFIVSLASDVDAESHAMVAAAHRCSAVGRVVSLVPATIKARVVGAALELGYRIPAVG